MCTLPTAAEASAPRVAANVAAVTDELTRLAASGRISPLLIIDNDTINRMYPELTVANFLPTINETASGLLDIFNRLSASAAGFDGRAFTKVVRAGGWCVMGLATLDPNANEAALAVQMCTQVPATLLADGFKLETASAVGVLVVGSAGVFKSATALRKSLPGAVEALKQLTGRATLACGILEDDRPGLRVYTIIGGLEPPTQRLASLEPAA